MSGLQRAGEHGPVSFLLNGSPATVAVEPRTSLADALRDNLLSPGTRLGCEHGVCGACTVLIDGASCRSCLVLAVQCEGTVVLTVEGLSPGIDALHPLQDAFRRFHALQCGFCTSGMLIVALELLRTKTGLSEAGVREAMSGNLCRCTGYQGIVDAIMWTDQHWDRSEEGVAPAAADRERLVREDWAPRDGKDAL